MRTRSTLNLALGAMLFIFGAPSIAQHTHAGGSMQGSNMQGSMTHGSMMERSMMQDMGPMMKDMGPAQRELMGAMRHMNHEMMQGLLEKDPGRAWMKSMAAHHQGAIDMSVIIQRHTRHGQVLQEARKTERDNRRALAELRTKMH